MTTKLKLIYLSNFILTIIITSLAILYFIEGSKLYYISTDQSAYIELMSWVWTFTFLLWAILVLLVLLLFYLTKVLRTNSISFIKTNIFFVPIVVITIIFGVPSYYSSINLNAAVNENNDYYISKLIESTDIKENGGRIATTIIGTEFDYKYILALIERGLNCNYSDSGGKSLFMYATQKQDIPIMKVLLKNGADINSLDNFGRNALFYATYSDNAQSNFDTFEFLLSNGCDYRVKTVDKDTILTDSIPTSSTKGMLVMKLIVECGVDVNAINGSNESAIDLAISYNNYELITLLIDNGIDPNVHLGNGFTPLLAVVASATDFQKKYVSDCIKSLLNNGANINQINNEGKTVYQLTNQEYVLDLLKEYRK